MKGERITLWVMLAIGMLFWASTLFWPGLNMWMIVISAFLVAWCSFHLLRLRDEEKER